MKGKRFYVETRKSLFLVIVYKEKRSIILRKVMSKNKDFQMSNQETFRGNVITFERKKGLNLILMDKGKEIINISNITQIYGKIVPQEINK